MKPTQEQVEAARFFLYNWQMSGETVDDLAVRIAARDAERDARWEAERISWLNIIGKAEAAMNLAAAWLGREDPDINEIAGSHYRRLLIAASALGGLARVAALANLGAEEKR